MATQQEKSQMDWRGEWDIRPDTIYLNHGSFGPSPRVVLQVQREWQAAMACQPMDFLTRKLEPAWLAARERLAHFVGTAAKNLIFVENATAGMNLVADSFPLAAGDEVLLTDHEYGAVFRIWRRACEKVGATVQTATLAMPVTTSQAVVDSLFAAVTPRTRLIVVSHITSPTAIIFPVAEIVQRAKSAGIAVAIDGPHAPAQVDINLDQIGADFYTASLHKWLSAPLGSGFLHVSPAWQKSLRPAVLSWGKLPPEVPTLFGDEFFWSGTRDYSPYLAVVPAIDFLENVGIASFRQQTHALAQYARQQLLSLVQPRLASLGLSSHLPLVPDDTQWYGNMALVPLPPGNRKALQDALWTQHQIEVPIIDFAGQRYIRVSCHLYNDASHIDRLVTALTERLDVERL